MADTTYAVKVNDEVKERLQKLVDESGLSSKDFFADMISQFELLNAKKQTPILSADIDELVKLTTRINNIFINVGERVSNLQETYQHEVAIQTKEKESLIGLLQQQVDGLKRDAIQTEEQVNALAADNEILRKGKAEVEKNYAAEIGQLKEMNKKNDEIISGHNEKIDTLSGLVNKYKGYADENEVLKREADEEHRAADKLRQENEKLNNLLAGNENRLNELTEKHSEEFERQKEKFELEKGRELLEQREQYNRELDEIRNVYQEKINQFLQLNNSKTKDDVKAKNV